MFYQDLKKASCPYCGEPIELLLDGSVAEQEYIEDCQVCCRPMVVQCCAAEEENGEVSVTVRREDE